MSFNISKCKAKLTLTSFTYILHRAARLRDRGEGSRSLVMWLRGLVIDVSLPVILQSDYLVLNIYLAMSSTKKIKDRRKMLPMYDKY